MVKKGELTQRYARDLKEKRGVTFDSDLLTKVVKGLEFSIYNTGATLVSSYDKDEAATAKSNCLIKKPGLGNNATLEGGHAKVFEQYGKNTCNKHRAMVYYLLIKPLKKEFIYS